MAFPQSTMALSRLLKVKAMTTMKNSLLFKKKKDIKHINLHHLEAWSPLYYPHHSWVFKHLSSAQSSPVSSASATLPHGSPWHIVLPLSGRGDVRRRHRFGVWWWRCCRWWWWWLSKWKETTTGVLCGPISIQIYDTDVCRRRLGLLSVNSSQHFRKFI